MTHDNTKHTPGPWVWTDMDQLIAPNSSVVDVIVETDSGVYPPYGADRHLIAAAPDLLEALVGLRAILEVAESNASGNLEWFSVSPKIEAARAAIAKAQGREVAP